MSSDVRAIQSELGRLEGLRRRVMKEQSEAEEDIRKLEESALPGSARWEHLRGRRDHLRAQVAALGDRLVEIADEERLLRARLPGEDEIREAQARIEQLREEASQLSDGRRHSWEQLLVALRAAEAAARSLAEVEGQARQLRAEAATLEIESGVDAMLPDPPAARGSAHEVQLIAALVRGAAATGRLRSETIRELDRLRQAAKVA